MRPSPLLLSLATVTAVLAVGWSAGRAAPPPVSSHPPATATDSSAVALAHDLRSDSASGVGSSCYAPSVLSMHGPDDARDLGALAACRPGDAWSKLVDREQAASKRCNTAGRPVDLARVQQGAVALDVATVAHVRSVFRAGRAQGRRADAFGLVGDSMTVSSSFLAPFASSSARALVPSDVERTLSLAAPRAGARNVLDLFRGAGAGSRADDANLAQDSFVAPRAAKVGMRATWPLTPRGFKQATPIDEMVAAVSPAYAVVLYGANDALWRTDSVDLLVRGFDAALTAIVDALEARGIVPILTTIPKHMRERGWPDCAVTPTSGGNERFAVQATVLSDTVADLACRRHLPLIDLRWALDPLLDHGVGPDGIHLSVHPTGGGVLDGSGLACGINVQNLVTLRERTRVVDATSW
jgi:hypothetical protein